jgi:hypothetical protein
VGVAQAISISILLNVVVDNGVGVGVGVERNQTAAEFPPTIEDPFFTVR